jgi:hypothetical protein
VNDHGVEITDKVRGKAVEINKLSASDDGKTLTTDWRTIFDNGKESGGKFDSEREGGAPAAANKVSGEWRPVRTNASEDVITTTYKATAAGFAMSDPTRGVPTPQGSTARNIASREIRESPAFL